jgi:hypothetical protein
LGLGLESPLKQAELPMASTSARASSPKQSPRRKSTAIARDASGVPG